MIDALKSRISRLNAWGERSVNRRIFVAALTVGGSALVVRSAGMVKEMAVAGRFGVSDALDAFLVALLLPTFAITVTAGSFNSAFIPTFVQVREKDGPEEAQRLLSGVAALNIAALIAISAVLALTSPYLLRVVGSGFGPQKMAMTRSLFLVLLPCLVISGLSTLWGAVLNAGERFAMAAISPVMTPVFTVVSIVLLGRALGIYSIAAGVVGGSVMEAVILAAGLRRLGFSVMPRWLGITPQIKSVVKLYLPMAMGSLVMGGTTIVDRAMAAMLGPGSVSALNYGTKVTSFSLGVGSLALSTAAFPYLARMVAVEDWKGIRHTLRTYIRLVLYITVPLTAALVSFSAPIVRLLFERGAFTSADTALVSSVQAFFLLQAPFYVLGILAVRLMTSLKPSSRVIMGGALINFCVNISLNYVLMKWIGVAGIALSTSVVYMVSLVYCSAYILWRSPVFKRQPPCV